MEKLEYQKTNWVDEEVNEDGEVIKEGTPINAENMNKLESIIETLVNEVNVQAKKIADLENKLQSQQEVSKTLKKLSDELKTTA